MGAHSTAEKKAGARIRTLRLRKKWSLAVLGEKVGLTRQAVYRIEQGEVATPLSRLEQFAGALGTSLPSLLKDGR
jgi:transcriptional regulator with XRE-family HTH domain